VILAFDRVAHAYATGFALTEITFEAGDRGAVGIIGANGSGKTTLLHLGAGLLSPTRGRVHIDGVPVDRMRPRRRARHLTMTEQATPAPAGLSVEAVVSFGRHPHRRFLGALSPTDRRLIDDSLALCDLLPLRRRRVDRLSGGEWRRVTLALALAQRTRLLLMDEPFAHLDPHHVASLVRILSDLSATSRGLVIAAHDVNAVARVASRLVVLAGGTIHSVGPVASAFHPDTMEAAYGPSVRIVAGPEGPWVCPDYAARGGRHEIFESARGGERPTRLPPRRGADGDRRRGDGDVAPR